MAAGCNRDERPEPSPAQVEHKTDDLLVFDDALRVADDSVNEFVARAMKTATSGDYAQFRLLWATREEPMPKAQFEEGWQAVEQIRIRALEQAFIELPPSSEGQQPAQEDVYLVLAEMRFDPKHPAAKKEATREAVLMVVREQQQWRLAHAPKLMRDWIRQKAGATPEESSDKSRDSEGASSAREAQEGG